MPSRCRDSAPRRAPLSLSHLGLAPTAPASSRPMSPGPEAGSPRTADGRAQQLCLGFRPRSYPDVRFPGDPTSQGAPTEQTPVEFICETSAGPGTLEEPDTAYDGLASQSRMRTALGCLLRARQGTATQERTLFILTSLPREEAWLVAPFYKVKKRDCESLVICPRLGRGVRILI